MPEPNDGGPAFPRARYDDSPGISKREYFAAAAMQGMLLGHRENWHVPALLVQQAFQYADAMLVAGAFQPDPPVERPVEQAEEFCEE